MENNLIIGNTSQLSYFFPKDFIRISSRNVDMDYLKNNEWNSVYITFAEQRTNNDGVDCITPNFIYTIEILNNLIENSKKIVVYTTCELWNDYVGRVSINDPPKWTWPNRNGYCLSKEMLMNYILIKRKKDWNNIIIIHPFNFNSSYRRMDFLFGKIYDSIINKKQIEIGDTYFYRDIIHTKYVVKRSILSNDDEMVGSGRLTLVNDYIRDLYGSFNMDYNFYVKENLEKKARHSEKLFYSEQKNIYSYDMLLNDSIEDIKDRLEILNNNLF